jgi:hypothetical protein
MGNKTRQKSQELEVSKNEKMKSIRIIASIFAFCLLLPSAFGQSAQVSGTVTNKTTGKPAANETVTLVSPMAGMAEVGHATTDASGRYTLTLPSNAPYLIRVTHQGAGYFIAAPQSGPGDIAVYDVAPKVDGVTLAERVIGVETDNGQLRVVERYSIHNNSSPARTQWSPHSFQIVIPADAVLGDVSAQRPGAGSLPTSVKLDPDGAKGHYSFNFPIEPDADNKGTLFQLQYTLPFGSSSYTFHSQVTIPADTMWVVLPKSMTFNGAGFQASPQDPTVQTFMARDVMPGKTVEFSVSGTGSFPREDQGSSAAADGNQGAAAQPSGPGGGIGEPINTPDPLSKYKWWILGGLALLLAAAAAFLLRRPEAAVAGVPGTAMAMEAPAVFTPSTTAPGAKNAALLNALKEELFTLESERLSGTIPPPEYAEAKAALETVLKRALKRST